jgi:hypothetical protein
MDGGGKEQRSFPMQGNRNGFPLGFSAGSDNLTVRANFAHGNSSDNPASSQSSASPDGRTVPIAASSGDTTLHGR